MALSVCGIKESSVKPLKAHVLEKPEGFRLYVLFDQVKNRVENRLHMETA